MSIHLKQNQQIYDSMKKAHINIFYDSMKKAHINIFYDSGFHYTILLKILIPSHLPNPINYSELLNTRSLGARWAPTSS